MTSSQHPEPIWVPQRDLRPGDVCQGRQGEAVLVGRATEGPTERLLWRTADGETSVSTLTEDERDYVKALIRREVV
jgi:hypothetical protein